MGRYPFPEASNAYLEFVRPFVAELAAKERGRKLRMIASALADLDTERWTLTIEHPKGEGAWASAGERIAIFPSVRSNVVDFLDARARRVHGLGLDPQRFEPLIPNDRAESYTEAGWRRRRLRTFREAGVEGANFRILRPIFVRFTASPQISQCGARYTAALERRTRR